MAPARPLFARAHRQSALSNASACSSTWINSAKDFRHPHSKPRHELLFEPLIASKPAIVGRTRMRQRNDARPLSPPVTDGLGQAVAILGHVIRRRVLPDDQCQLHLLERLQQSCAPDRSTLRPRRQVARFTFAGVAERHRHDGEQLRVVELIGRDTQPPAQSIAACIVERDAGLVNLAAGCLGGDQNACGRMRLQYRAGTERQSVGAVITGANVGEERSERRHG